MNWLTGEEWSAIMLSLRVAAVAAIGGLPAAIVLAYCLARRRFWGKSLLETAINLPLVLPPVVTGYVLLLLLAPGGLVGSRLLAWFGLRLVFTWWAAAIASLLLSFPLAVRAIRLAFEAVDPRLELAARSLGAGPWRAFFTITLPLARRGIVAGTVLAFARSLGEFGATIMVAGNIAGQTQTIPLAIYSMSNRPDGMEATWRLVAMAVALAFAALWVSEWLQRRAAG